MTILAYCEGCGKHKLIRGYGLCSPCKRENDPWQWQPNNDLISPPKPHPGEKALVPGNIPSRHFETIIRDDLVDVRRNRRIKELFKSFIPNHLTDSDAWFFLKNSEKF